MAFVLKKTASYKWPVTVETPVDGGKFDKQTFDAVFKKMSRSAFNDLVDKGDDALIDGILEGWDGIKDEEGKEIPFTQKTKKELCDDPYVIKALIQAYADSVTGAPAKN
jgi:hypothetical protein